MGRFIYPYYTLLVNLTNVQKTKYSGTVMEEETLRKLTRTAIRKIGVLKLDNIARGKLKPSNPLLYEVY